MNVTTVEQRKYVREKLGISGNLYLVLPKRGQLEIAGTIENIGEFGIGFSFAENKLILDEIEDGLRGSLIFTDTYKIFHEEKFKYVIIQNVQIRWHMLHKGRMYIGCQMSHMTDEVEEYISDKKLLSYLNLLKIKE